MISHFRRTDLAVTTHDYVFTSWYPVWMRQAGSHIGEQNKTKLDPTLPHSSMRPSSSLGVFHERNDLLPLCALQGQSHLESGECLECYPPVMEVRSCKVHSQLFEYVPGRSKAPISSLSHTCEGGLQAPLDSRGSKGEKPPLLSVKS